MILIEVNAIRRSGHHAFIQWLISNMHGVRYEENICKWKYNHIGNNPSVLWVNEGEFRTKEIIDYISKRTHIDVVIISYESFTKETLNNPNYSILTDELKEMWGVGKHLHIPFIRTFHNNFASLSKAHPFENDKNLIENYLTLYKGQLKKLLTTSNGVLYDKWVSDEKYANEVCLNMLNKPNQFHPLEIGGTGSSFEGKINMESLLNRHKNINFPSWLTEDKNLNKDIRAITNMMNDE